MVMAHCPHDLDDEDETHAIDSMQSLTPDFYQDPALTVASLLRMMTRFPSRCSSALAQSIAGHLQLLVSDGRQHPEVRVCAAELLEDWSHMAILTAQPDNHSTNDGALH